MRDYSLREFHKNATAVFFRCLYSGDWQHAEAINCPTIIITFPYTRPLFACESDKYCIFCSVRHRVRYLDTHCDIFFELSIEIYFSAFSFFFVKFLKLLAINTLNNNKNSLMISHIRFNFLVTHQLWHLHWNFFCVRLVCAAAAGRFRCGRDKVGSAGPWNLVELFLCVTFIHRFLCFCYCCFPSGLWVNFTTNPVNFQ